MTTLSDLDGTRWTGSAELWLDPLGNDAARSECTVAIDGQTVRYTLSDEGQAHQGSIAVGDDGADFTDTFHQPEPARFRRLSDAWGCSRSRPSTAPKRTGAGGSGCPCDRRRRAPSSR